jgi:hypothetical protein
MTPQPGGTMSWTDRCQGRGATEARDAGHAWARRTGLLPGRGALADLARCLLTPGWGLAGLAGAARQLPVVPAARGLWVPAA